MAIKRKHDINLNYINKMRPDYISYKYCIELQSEVKSASVSNSSETNKNTCYAESHVSYNMMLYKGSKYEKLSYSGQKCHRIPEALIKMYGNKIQSLDLSYNELVSLKGLDGFPLLRELVLDNNHLSDSLVIPFLPHLHTLSVNKNHITDIELLINKIRHNLPSLTYLSLLGNKACPNQLSDVDNDEADYQRYRYYVLHHLPKLQFLDSSRVREVERAEAKRRGQFMKVVRPKVVVTQPDRRQDSSLTPYTPLPRNLRGLEDHRGAYGKCRYRYSGKHSEGNRFISNNDL